MNKGTNLISEIGQYFKENDAISHGVESNSKCKVSKSD